MKPILIPICLLILLSSCNMVTDIEDSIPESETFVAKVIKVYSIEDNGARNRAYIVKWKEVEVIAEDPLAQTDFSEGDTVEVLAIRTMTTKNNVTKKHLSFVIKP